MKNSNGRIPVGDRVTIFPRGKKEIWTADFWYNGQHQRVSLQTRNKKVAIQRAVKLENELLDGSYRRIANTVTIESAIDDYLAHLETEGRARKTIVRYRGELTTLAGFCKTHRAVRLTQITPQLFDRFRSARKKSHCLKTLYHEGMVCKQFLKWCVSRHLISQNPLLDYKLQPPPLRVKPAPSLEEVRRILAASTTRQCDLFATLAFTGMRSGELQRLRTEDVDLDANWLSIVSREGAETKTRQSRKVPIPPLLRRVLARYSKSPGPWFFTSEPSPRYPAGDHWISTKRLNDGFISIARRLGLPVGRKANGYTTHSLRHFFETFCVNSGIPQRVIDTWLGHRSDRSMAAVYYCLADEESQAFMRKVPFGDGVPAADAGAERREER